MKYQFIFILSVLIFSGCNDISPKSEKDNAKNEQKDRKKVNSKQVAKRELRYLYFANGGIIAYFNDGTVAGCPNCDFCKSNIIATFDKKPYATYVIQKDGSLLIDGKEREVPTFDSSDFDRWALIDYKWNIKPPQY